MLSALFVNGLESAPSDSQSTGHRFKSDRRLH